MTDLAKIESSFLLDLAAGKYDAQVSDLAAVLAMLGPLGLSARAALLDLVLLNKYTAPQHVVPDGRGGMVPDTNSRYDSKTGEFL